MNELTFHISLVLLGASVMLILLGLAVAVIMPAIDRWSKIFFIAFFSVLTLYALFGLVDEFASRDPALRSFLIIAYYFETLLASGLIPMIAAYLLHCCGEAWQSSLLFRTVAALWIISFIMTSLSPFTPLFYSVTPDYQFYRGPLYPLLIMTFLAMQAINLSGVIRRRGRLSGKNYYAFLICMIPMTAAMFIHLFISVFLFFGLGFAICALSMFGIILFGQIEQNLHQQKEIAHQRASIMVLQMRPHFIYNTMMSIYYLCKQNPDLAQRVTLEFTTYLRKNFTAISSEEPIPFSEELEHARAYLAVEQAQFDDSLFVSFDTPHTDFRVPPLTLQPIVENAVKHGMDPDAGPLHILVRTRRTDTGSEIIVENTGTDFEPASDSEPHIALKNIRQRLEMMCRGKMTIAPRPGGGTVVRVTIPNQGPIKGRFSD